MKLPMIFPKKSKSFLQIQPALSLLFPIQVNSPPAIDHNCDIKRKIRALPLSGQRHSCGVRWESRQDKEKLHHLEERDGKME